MLTVRIVTLKAADEAFWYYLDEFEFVRILDVASELKESDDISVEVWFDEETVWTWDRPEV